MKKITAQLLWECVKVGFQKERIFDVNGKPYEEYSWDGTPDYQQAVYVEAAKELNERLSKQITT